MKVIYRPEMLFFNEHVRRNKLTPETHPEVYFPTSEEDLSLLDAFKYILFQFQPGEVTGKHSWNEVISEFFPHVKWQGETAINEWLHFVKGLELDQQFDGYIDAIFNLFGTSFEVPHFNVHPVILNPDRKWFDMFYYQTYNFRQVYRYNKAFYEANSHKIFIPVPDKSMKINDAMLTMIGLHEILHAPFRCVYGGFSIAGPTINSDLNLSNLESVGEFSEVFCNAIAAHLIITQKSLSRDKGIEMVAHAGLLNLNPKFWNAFTFMSSVGFDTICRIMKPVIGLGAEVAHLLKESDSIQHVSDKRLRGMLRKKSLYRSSVKGMDGKKLKMEVAKKLTTKWKHLAGKIEQTNPLRLILQAAATEKDERRKKVLCALANMFDQDQEQGVMI